MRNRAEISARQISAFDGTTLRSYDRFLKRPRKALHSIFESAARVTGSVRFISGHERLPNDALLLTENHLNLLFSDHYCEDNMSNIPFEKQHLLVNPIAQIDND